MSDRKYQIHSYATWILSTITVIEILKTSDASGHAQQLSYVLEKFFELTADKFGDDFRDEFHSMFEKIHGPTPSDEDKHSAVGETLH